MCISCNLREEKEKPWLLQRVADADGSHGLQHTLVLVTNPSTSTEGRLTTTERFDRLEGKLNEQANASDELRTRFAEHERVMSERFQRLEELLERVLAMGGTWR